MSINIVLEINSDPNKLETLITTLQAILPDTRGYDGCNEVVVLANQDDPYNFILLENWENREKYEKYLSWRQERGDLDALGEMLSQPPLIKFYNISSL